MPLADSLLGKLQGRVQTLTQRRAELLQKRIDDLAKIDAQLQACKDLAQGWQTMPVQQGLTLVEAAGISLKVED